MSYSRARLLDIMGHRYDYYSARTLLNEAERAAHLEQKDSYTAPEIARLLVAIGQLGTRQEGMLEQIRSWAGLAATAVEVAVDAAAVAVGASGLAGHGVQVDASTVPPPEAPPAAKPVEPAPATPASAEGSPPPPAPIESAPPTPPAPAPIVEAAPVASAPAAPSPVAPQSEATERSPAPSALPTAAAAPAPAPTPAAPSAVAPQSEPTERAPEAQPTETAVEIVLRSGPGKEGLQVFMTGEGETLGNWNPAQGVALEEDDQGNWRALASLPPGTSLAFKFVAMGEGDRTIWESGPNHAWVVPSAHQAKLETDWQGNA